MTDTQSEATTTEPAAGPRKPTFTEAKNRRQKARAAGLDPNYWYAVEHDSALARGAVQEVKFWGTSVALYRDAKGRLHAVEDRCAHRQLRLSLGVVVGDRLVCQYHGWEYNGCGELVGVGHSLFGKAMPKCKLRHYPVRERYGLIWIFFGDPARAEQTRMPEIPELEGENRWECVPVDFTWRAHHSMIFDNVSDFTHAYLHRKYKPFTDAELTHLETVGDTVELSYDTKVGGGTISSRFVDKENTDTNSMTLALEYPYQRSSTDGKIKHWCFVLPIDENTTRAFFLFYFDCFVVPFTKVKIPEARDEAVPQDLERAAHQAAPPRGRHRRRGRAGRLRQALERARLQSQPRGPRLPGAHRQEVGGVRRVGGAPWRPGRGAEADPDQEARDGGDGSAVMSTTELSRDRRATVAILGAGPAGAACAAHLGQLGVQDVVLVDRHDFPRDKTCGSGLSPKGIQTLKDLGVWHEIEPLSYPINGIRLVTPGGLESWQSAGTKAEAVVCERRVLDHKILQRAIARGTEFIPGWNATGVLEKGGRVEGLRAADGAEIRARFVVIAGGAHCRIGLPENRPRQTIQAIMGWWEGVSFRPNHVEMVFDKMLSPYYGWLFPESDTRVNIGITYEDSADAPKHNARELFQAFLAKHYRARLADAKEIEELEGAPGRVELHAREAHAARRARRGRVGAHDPPGDRRGDLPGDALGDARRRGHQRHHEPELRRGHRVRGLRGGVPQDVPGVVPRRGGLPEGDADERARLGRARGADPRGAIGDGEAPRFNLRGRGPSRDERASSGPERATPRGERRRQRQERAGQR